MRYASIGAFEELLLHAWPTVPCSLGTQESCSEEQTQHCVAQPPQTFCALLRQLALSTQ